MDALTAELNRLRRERENLHTALGILAGEVASHAHTTPQESLEYLRRKVEEGDDRGGMLDCYRLAYERLAAEVAFDWSAERMDARPPLKLTA